NFERHAAPLIEAALRDHGLFNSTVIIRSRKAANRFAALGA
ncbi:MAG: DNA topology modulation protein FlaR, partial [Rhizobium leguminosarum]